MKIPSRDSTVWKIDRGTLAALWSIGLVILTGCKSEKTDLEIQPPETSNAGESAPGPLVVATFGEQEIISRSDVDKVILSAPDFRRNPGVTPFSEWYELWIHDIFLTRVLNTEAAGTDIEKTSSFLKETRGLRRNLYSEYRLRTALAAEKAITKDELQERYEETKDDWKTPETRHTFHLFLRIGDTPESSEAAVIERLNELRERVMNGENFGLLAEKYSESETRHRKGSLGDVVRGQLSEDADRVIFSLEEGEISKPVVIADGAHLFFNENTTAAGNPALEEVRGEILQSLRFERSKKVLSQLAGECKVQGGSFFPGKDELDRLLKEGHPDTVILALGTFELTIREFRSLITGYRKQIQNRHDFIGADAPEFLYEEIKNREILFQDMLADTESDYSQIEEVYETQKLATRNNHMLKRKLVTWLEKRPELLREFFKNNINRFQNPPQVHLQAIEVPISKDSDQIMALLEKAKQELDGGKTTLAKVAPSAGTTVDDWGWFSTAKLRAFDWKASKTAFGMQPGDFSPPYTIANSIRMFEVIESEEPPPISFEKARTRVIEMYLAVNRQKVLTAVRQEIEEEYNLQIHPSHFPSATSTIDPDTPPAPAAQ